LTLVTSVPAEEALDAQIACHAGRVEAGLRGLGHHLHVRRGAHGVDAIGERFQRLRRNAHVLEADVPQLKRRDLLEHIKAILDGLVAPRQHEDEVHRVLQTQIVDNRAGNRP
jgi:hypothetical protein